jgi:outer membrane lipoprotein SlyB
METTSASNANLSTSRHGFADRLQHSKALVAIVAVLGVTVMALAAALVVNRSDAQPGGSAAMAPAALASPATTPAPVPATTPKVVAAAPKITHPNSVTHSAPVTVAKAHVCADCGTVEAVTAVKRQGQVNGVAVGNTTIGIGTVAGGVLGGLLGNQVGNGNGKTLATVVGAAGGAYAGNKVEQSMKTVTVYDVRVRMNDGSVRNLDISTAPAVGSKVIVEGNNLRSVNGAG